MKKVRIVSLAAQAALIMSLAMGAACTKKSGDAPAGNTAETAAPAAQTAPTGAPAAPAAADASKVSAELAIGSDGDAIAFDKTELTVKAGETVRLKFKNNSKSSGMQHNWVLTKPGTDAQVAQAGIAAGAEKGWIPVGDANIIANTKLVDPGQEDSIVFTAPAAGDYPFICTFPGHAAAMKGVLKVK